MALVELRLVSGTTAAKLREATAGSEHQINPRRVEAGAYEGWHAFSANVVHDPDLATLLDGVTMRKATLDTEAAWPTPAEEEGTKDEGV